MLGISGIIMQATGFKGLSGLRLPLMDEMEGR